MARPALAARDLVAPSSSAASAAGLVAGDELASELLPPWRPELPTHASDFQRFLGQVVELAKISTGASGSAIAIRGEQGTICRARSGQGAPPLGAPVDTSAGISKQCLDSGASLRCDDIATDARVAPEISQAIGIRAVAVVPIYSDGAVSGILEVFSGAPGIFTDRHLKSLQQLANWVGSAARMLREEPICGSNVDVQRKGRPDITLLVALEPAYRVFFRNLADLVSLRSPARYPASSSQMPGWNDVLIDAHLPWKRFIESVFLHIVVAGMLAGVARIWPQELLVSPRPPRDAHVVYYPFSQSFPTRESSRPAVRPRRQQTSAYQELSGADRVASGTRGADNGHQIQPPGIGAVALPPPDIGEAEVRRSHLPYVSVVAHPPDLTVASGLRRINSPRASVVPPSPDVRGLMTRAGLTDAAQFRGGSTGAADISIVPPPPSINDHAVLTYGATGIVSKTGIQVVAPPPSVQARAKFNAGPGAISLGDGVSQVVPPPPSFEGTGNSVGGARTGSPVGGGSRVVPPPPSMQDGGNYGGGGRLGSLAHAASGVVSPPVQGGTGGGSGAGGRASSLARARADGGLPPAAARNAHNSELGGARAAKDGFSSSVLETGGNRMHPIPQEVQLRVIGLAWAPPRSTYFSNFEVFFAEKWLNKEEWQSIKLVYVFLPYQQRLSEYGFDELKVRKLRVTRDPTCDESLMQMAWSEGENGPAGPHHSSVALASTSTDRNELLPCYRTTADDYRQAVWRRR